MSLLHHHHFLTYFFLFLTCLCCYCPSLSTAQPPLQPLQPLPSYERNDIVLPTQYLVQLSKYQPLTLIQPYYLSAHYRLCERIPQVLVPLWKNISQFSSFSPFSSQKLQKLQESQQNKQNNSNATSNGIVVFDDTNREMQSWALDTCLTYFHHVWNVSVSNSGHKDWQHAASAFNFCYYCVNYSDNSTDVLQNDQERRKVMNGSLSFQSASLMLEKKTTHCFPRRRKGDNGGDKDGTVVVVDGDGDDSDDDKWRKRQLSLPLLFFAVDYLDFEKRLISTCLCEKNNARSFGVNCGRYQRVWIPVSMFVAPWVAFVLFLFALLFGYVFIVIPVLVQSVKLIFNCTGGSNGGGGGGVSVSAGGSSSSDMLQNEHSTTPVNQRVKRHNVLWTKIKQVFSVRNQALFFLMLSCTFTAIEQVFAFTFPLMGVRSYGLFRSISALLVPVYYFLIMIDWAHSCSVVEKDDTASTDSSPVTYRQDMHLFHRLMWIANYAQIIYFLVAVVVGIATRKILYTYILTVIYIVPTGIVLPIGFLVYGMRILIQVRKSFLYLDKKASLMRLRLTHFVIVAQLAFIVVVFLSILLLLTYADNWDILGLWFGVFRDRIVDFCVLLVSGLMMVMLTRPRAIMETYGTHIGSILLCRCCPAKKSKKRIIQLPHFAGDDDETTIDDDESSYYKFTSSGSAMHFAENDDHHHNN